MARDVGWIWKLTGWYIEPKTSREVMSVLGSIGVYSAGQRFAWRGMSSADYDLKSSLHRQMGGKLAEEDLRAAEVRLLSDARKWKLGIQPTGHVDDFQMLSDLQHYGIATRLLDFTNNPMTALWFACQAPKSPFVAKSGLLLAMNVTGWAEHSTLPGLEPISYGQTGDPNGARLKNALAGGKPFLVDSSNPNDRLRAQEGFFIAGQIPPPELISVDGSPVPVQWATPFQGLDIPFKIGQPQEVATRLTAERRRGAPEAMPFVAVIIRSGLKQKLLRYLESTYNRSARVLFPDYAGFLQFSREARQRT